MEIKVPRRTKIGMSNKLPQRFSVEIAIVLFIVIAGVIVVAYSSHRSKRDQDARIVYAELKSLPTFSKDFATPEGAILCLEDAYRHHDIKAAVACKDFGIEAKLMLQDLNRGLETNESRLKETTLDLEQTYRKDLEKSWPDFSHLESFFIHNKPYQKNIVVITEVCRFPDGLFSRQDLLVAETQNGWRVLNPISK